jgi:hypothetical protein
MIFDFINKGEANAGHNTDKYACSFSKMIHYWRQIWNQRTNGITDIQFPFGFVQVSFTEGYEKFHSYIEIFHVYSYRQIRKMVQKLAVSHGFGGTKHLMLAMFQIVLFQKSLWLLLWIYVMILMGRCIHSIDL